MRSAAITNKGLLIFFLLISLSCSPSARHKALRFFFDGVPEPEKQQDVAAPPQPDPLKPGPASQEPAVVLLSRHSDYTQKRCSLCHDKDAGNALIADRKQICFVCHKPEVYRGDYIHGPVAVGDCLSCHRPHESNLKKLLDKEGQDLCYKCHKAADVSEIDVHKKNTHIGCSECHEPHTSGNRFFLKAP